MRKCGPRGLIPSAIWALAMCSQAIAHPGGITTPSPDLPPDGVYLSPSDVHATYGGGALTIVLSAVQHQPFALLDPNDFECGSAGTPGQCETHHFESGLQAMVSINGGSEFPIAMEGPVRTIAYGKTPSNPTGVFPTEMLSMQLTGLGGASNVMVRAGSQLGLPPTLGQTSIIPIGGGMYHIDSFFDVFTELSLDGGQSWIPSQGPTHVTLYVPEPASVVLLALGLLGACGFARRR